MNPFAFLAAALAIIVAPAGAQPPPDPEATPVEALIVTSAIVGPPWWKAEKDGRMVYIMGLPTTVHEGLSFDQTTLGNRMSRAQRIIIPAEYRTDTENRRFELGAVLPPDLAARLEAARIALGQDQKRYARVRPLTAAARLSEDFRRRADLDWDGGYAGYHRQAGFRLFTRKVHAGLWGPEQPLDLETELVCLADVLDAVEAGPEAYRSAAEAWAVGDIAGALKGPRGDRWWRCAVPHMDVIVRYVALIEEAVASPGVEVVVAGVPVHSMVAQGGVVERLTAAGYRITDPAGLTGD